MKRVLFLIAFAVVSAGLMAQTVKVDAPNMVGTDEQFNVSFSVEGEHAVQEFEWSPSDAFKLVWGPQKSTSTSISIVNGKRSKTVTNSYTYVLMPLKAGTFTLPAGVATVQGKKISSRSFSIEVVAAKAGASASSSAQSSSSERNARATGTVSSDQIYMRLLVNKTRAVVGEGITATLKLYQQVNIRGFEDVKFPSFNGFWTQETVSPSNIEFKRENVGGVIFNTAVLRSWNIIPQKPGDFEIEPAELVCLVNVRNSAASSGSIFDSFFQDSYSTVRKRITTVPLTLHISPLPAGAPASFGGGVGKFEMRASLTKDSLNTHDAASVRISISGTGNLALLEAPKVSFPPDFEAYDVKASDSGRSRIFEYPFIPRSHGEFEIGPIEYSYYDISAGRYVTLSSGPLPLVVERGAELESTVPSGGQLVQNRREVKDLGSDIRFISTNVPSFSRTGSFFVFSPLYLGLAALLLLAAFAVWFVMRRISARRADVAGTRNRGATRMARKRLASAGDYLQKNLWSAFYEELHKALLGYVSDKFAMDAGELNRDNIVERLQSEGVSASLAEDYAKLLDECEYARYSPDTGHDAMNVHFENAVAVISAIDSSIKKNGGSKIAGAALILMLSVIPFSAGAKDIVLDSLWNAGTSVYADGKHGEAFDAWNEIASQGYESAELYTNMGDACFKNQDLAGSILWYSRALKLDPSYKDARFNLEFARTLTQDHIEEVPEFLLRQFFRKVGYTMSSDSWAVISLLALAAMLAMLLLFLLSRSSSGRMWGFFTGVAMLLVFILCVSFAASQKADYMRAEDAVVMRPVVSVKSSPAASDAKDLFILHEGTCIKVMDVVGKWYKIRLTDGREGWCEQSVVDII